MTREKIEDIRFIVIPFVVNILKGINYEGQGDSDAKEFIDDFNVIFDLAIKALEQEPRWIPISEKLPEDSGEYFVTVIDEDVETYKHTGIAWYAHPKDYDVEEGDWRELMIDEKVIAWMPLPKAYREVEA